METTLTWDAPTAYTDASPADVVAGYRLYHGTESGDYSGSVTIGDQTSYLLTGLPDASILYFAVTALATNSTESEYSEELVWERKVQVPTISSTPGGGPDERTITLATPTDAATVHVTTDGGNPTAASSVYSGPFVLTVPATVKAIAVKNGMQDSEIAEAVLVATPDWWDPNWTRRMELTMDTSAQTETL